MPAPMPDGALAGILKRDRLVVGLALAVLTALAWGYTLTLAAQMNVPVQSMDGMSGMTMPDTVSWSLQHLSLIHI